MNACEYCGTELDDDGTEESTIPAAGPRITHFASVCLGRVHAALRVYKRENVVLRRLAEAASEFYFHDERFRIRKHTDGTWRLGDWTVQQWHCPLTHATEGIMCDSRWTLEDAIAKADQLAGVTSPPVTPIRQEKP